MSIDEFRELSAGHAVHALSPEDESRYAAAIAEHPEWRAEAELDAETAARLADALPGEPPPPGLRERLLAAIPDAGSRGDAGPRDAAMLDPIEGRPSPEAGTRRRPRRRFALAASLALLLAIGAGTTYALLAPRESVGDQTLAEIQRQPDALSATADITGGGAATLYWSGGLGQAVLVPTGLPSIASDRQFELWYIRDGAPVPAGVFSPAGLPLSVLLSGRMLPGDAVALTVEAAGGSATGLPTSTPILVISTG